MQRLAISAACLTLLSASAMAADFGYGYGYETRETYYDRPVVERERIIERHYYHAPIIEQRVFETYALPRIFPPAYVYRHVADDDDYSYRRRAYRRFNPGW